MTTVDQLLWSRVDRSGVMASCWPYSGPLTRTGYGRLTIAGLWGAHRIAWREFNGAIPVGVEE